MKRTWDLFHKSSYHGAFIVEEFGVTQPLHMYVLQQQTLGDAAFTLGHVLQVGAQCKPTSECQSAGVEFIHIVAKF